MSAPLLARLALLHLLVLPLRLIPPGLSEHRTQGDSTAAELHMPAALKGGSRAASDQGFDRYLARATIGPSPARLGQRLVYRGAVLVYPGTKVKFEPPGSAGNFTWGRARASRKGTGSTVFHPQIGYFGADSFTVEIPLQVFSTGFVAIPGPRLTLEPVGMGNKILNGRLPVVRLLVMPSLTEADSSATLRPVRGPLGAPWWERVPWGLVLLAIAVIGGVVALVIGRRRRKVLPVAAPVARPRPAPDPSSEALAALARLRAERLPALGRFGDHSLALTRILRRYLEATLGSPRPGDTSSELLARLRERRLDPADLRRLEGLMGLWDRVKFARAPMDAGEAGRCEDAVEQLVRRHDLPREVA